MRSLVTPERWRQINELFHAALERMPNRRVAFLDEACGGDGVLRSEVESLLKAHEGAATFIEAPASDIAAGLLADGQVQLQAGQDIAHYTITTFLRKGGMGEVYRAQDKTLDRSVALKLLPAQFTVDTERVGRFQQEARAASALNHPNIVTVYEIGQSGSSHFIATEFIDGETLRQRMDAGRMTLGEVLDIAAQAASALAAAHEAGIVHRDIKPENIMLRRDGLVKVLDFGLAKLTSPHTTAGGRRSAGRMVDTIPGVILGTVKYMSPEQARGDDTDHRTDLWSLGAVLYEMTTGRVPFEGETSSHVIISILESQQSALASYSEARPELERIVQKLLRKDRRERYQTANDLAVDLKNLKQELEVQVRLKRQLGTTGRESVGRAGMADIDAHIEPPGPSSGSMPGRMNSRESVTGGKPRPRRYTLAVVVAALAAIAIVTSIYLLVLPSDAIDSVGVVRFVNASGDPALEYVANGFSDSIIVRLQSLTKLRVISLGQRDGGTRTNVRTVLMGNVAQYGDRLAVTTQLIDARDYHPLWEHTYSGQQLSSVLQLEDEIVSDLAQKLRLRMSSAESTRLAKHPTDNMQAYEDYEQGRSWFDRRTPEGIKQSVILFRKALREDPGYALAHAGLANALTPSDLELAPEQNKAEAEDNAQQALKLDDSLAQTHTAWARVLLFHDLNWHAAETELHRTIDAYPNYEEAHHMYSHYLMYVGRTDRSLAEAQKAIEINSVDILLNVHLGWTYLYARQYERAIEQLKRTIDKDQTCCRGRLFLGKAYELTRMYKEALEEFTKAYNLEEGIHKETTPALGHLYAVSGRRAEALNVIETLRQRHERGQASAYDLAEVYAGLGDSDQALMWLQRAANDHIGGVLMVKAEPIFDNLRRDPRYINLLREMNFPE
jgi:serine/threonine-protein kinase